MIFLNKMDKVKINIVHLPKKNIETDDGEEYHISTFLSTNILTGTSPDESPDEVMILSTNDVQGKTPVISTDVVPDETPVISTGVNEYNLRCKITLYYFQFNGN